MSKKVTKVVLSERDLPKQWYNIQADLPKPLHPPLHPGTGQPIKPEDLEQIFPLNLVEQELSTERWIDIPDEVLDKLLLWRPTPLQRARNLEKYLQTPAKIYYKNEGSAPPGATSPIPPSPRPTTTSSLASSGSPLKRSGTVGLGPRPELPPLWPGMQGLHGAGELRAEAVPPPDDADLGRRMRAQPQPGHRVRPAGAEGKSRQQRQPGIAISEAIEDCLNSENTRYSLGSVLNHVLLHQTIIGLEAQKQLAAIGNTPTLSPAASAAAATSAGWPSPSSGIRSTAARLKSTPSNPPPAPP